MNEAIEIASEPPSPGCLAEEKSDPPSQARAKKRKDSENESVLSSRKASFLKNFYPSISVYEWNDWRWQLKNRITSFHVLKSILKCTAEEASALQEGCDLPFAVTPYYLSLIHSEPLHPLRKSIIPTQNEKIVAPEEQGDPLGEDHDSPVPGIVHRYPDRVLFLVTNYCSTYCRYCTRSRRVGKNDLGPESIKNWNKGLEYIKSNEKVRDVLISGGDPLTLPDSAIEYLLKRLRQIPHVEIIRIGTKVPMVLPQRITSDLVRMLKRYHPLFISVHCTHPDELTPESNTAFQRLADAGIPLGSQTVLLKGVNDSIPTLTALYHGLLKNRVRPYYLYQCDLVVGTSHFRTTVSKGLELIRGMRGHTSGYAIPHYVVDLPNGGGKTPVSPNYLEEADADALFFKNYEGRIFRVPDADSMDLKKEYSAQRNCCS